MFLPQQEQYKNVDSAAHLLSQVSLPLHRFLSSRHSGPPHPSLTSLLLLLERVPRKEQRHERQQRPVDQQQLLPARHRVGPQAVLLVLGKARHHLDAALELLLARAADGAVVVLGEVLEEHALGDWEVGVAVLGLVLVAVRLLVPLLSLWFVVVGWWIGVVGFVGGVVVVVVVVVLCVCSVALPPALFVSPPHRRRPRLMLSRLVSPLSLSLFAHPSLSLSFSPASLALGRAAADDHELLGGAQALRLGLLAGDLRVGVLPCVCSCE